MIKIVKGNILEAKERYIVHQVNCQGVMGSGVAKQIKEKYPRAFDEYKIICDINKQRGNLTSSLLGCVQFIDVEFKEFDGKDKTIVNLFGQDRYGLDKRHTNYIALVNGIAQIFNSVYEDIALPYKMGCDRGGADWNKFYNVLECLAEDFKYNIVIYKL